MEINYYHQKRILVHYTFMKLSGKIENLSMEDLANYFEDKGWHMYETEEMIQNIQDWKNLKEMKRKLVYS
jgi:replication initiation and membrane attachment protein DnaB